MAQVKLIVSNWKMNLKLSNAKSLVVKLIKTMEKKKSYVKKIICPQFLLIPDIAKLIKNSKIFLGAQDCHYEEKGAFTGESSISLLKFFKCKYVVLGHSERRENNGDSNLIIAKKINTAIKFGLIPIVCIGESINLRKKKEYLDFLKIQLNECISTGINDIIIAYEPIWSIGTGLIPSCEEILEIKNFVKEHLTEKKNIKKVRFLYGGSVSSDNIKGIIEKSDVDGALIGGASLNVNEIKKIINIFNFY